MTTLAATDAPPEFRPRPRYHIQWDLVGAIAAGLVGLALAAYAALLIARPADAPDWLARRGLDLLALAFLVGLTPTALILTKRRKRLLELDARLPDFLTDLASLHKAGLTLQDALTTASRGDYGALSPDVKTAAEQLRWNIPVLAALENLRDRLGTPIADRTLTVVIEGAKTGGNVPEVLEVAAKNARGFIQLREQRARTMGLYMLITYVASVIFIGVALALHTIFVPKMIGAYTKTQDSGLGLAHNSPSAIEFRSLFYTAALVQAIGNGIVGGIMAEGKASAGLRHALTMTALAWVGFLLFP